MTNASEQAIKWLFSFYDPFIHGNPWLLSSMLQKSSLPRQSWNKSYYSYTQLKLLTVLLLSPELIFFAQKLFQNIKSPPQDFSQTGEIILLGVGQRAWNTLWGFFGIQYLNDLGQDSFLEVVEVKWAAFGWNATTLTIKNDQLMLRLMRRMIFWC